MKHRKLFPFFSETNQTSDCSDFCDSSSCSYNCYPLPDYYFIPPPLPSSSISPADHQNNKNIDVFIITIISLLATFIIFLLSYFFIKRWRKRNTDVNLHQTRSNDPESQVVQENQIDHPIWFIRTVGLQERVINSITVCRYNGQEGLIEGTECSVCLNEFREGENLRLLPKCNHAFHVLCIDTWLRSHTNCPLCRACIVSGEIVSVSETVQLNSGDSDPVLYTGMENSETEGDFVEDLERNEEQSEDRDETERNEVDFENPEIVDKVCELNKILNTQMENLEIRSGLDQEDQAEQDESEHKSREARELEEA